MQNIEQQLKILPDTEEMLHKSFENQKILLSASKCLKLYIVIKTKMNIITYIYVYAYEIYAYILHVH